MEEYYDGSFQINSLLVSAYYALIVWRWAAYHKQSAFVVIVYIYRWARVSLCEEHAAITGKLGKKIDLNTTSHIYPARGLTSEREKTHTHTRLSYELLYSSNSGAFSVNEGWSLRSRFLWTLFFINFWHNKGNNNWSKQRGGKHTETALSNAGPPFLLLARRFQPWWKKLKLSRIFFPCPFPY